MAEHHEGIEVELLTQCLKPGLRFVFDKICKQGAGEGRRAPETQPIIGNDPAPTRLGQLFRKLTPQGHTTQRVVQQHNRCAVVHSRVPGLSKQLPVRGVDPVLFDRDGLHRSSSIAISAVISLNNATGLYLQEPLP
ncbi:hypothetical protein D3C77_460930 [compost metagenome]